MQNEELIKSLRSDAEWAHANEWEEWRPVNEYEGLYEVSNLGRIKSVAKAIYLMPSIREGYQFVTLSKNGKKLSKNVHRLVAKAFIPNPNNLPLINHKDENKQNNNVNNLEWCTPKYNSNYGAGAKRSALARSIPVKQISEDGTFVIWNSFHEAQESSGVSRRDIYRVCEGKRKKAGGYIWERAI